MPSEIAHDVLATRADVALKLVILVILIAVIVGALAGQAIVARWRHQRRS